MNDPLDIRLSRQSRKKLAKMTGQPFVPQAPPAKNDPRLADLHDEAKKLDDMIESMNALALDSDKPKWFILGPYVFHLDGEIYFHNSMSDMEKWTVLDWAEAEKAREYLRAQMKPKATEPEA